MESLCNLKKIEESLLLYSDPKAEDETLLSLWNDLHCGRYFKILESDTAAKIFQTYSDSSSSELDIIFGDAVEKYLFQGSIQCQWDVLIVGIAGLQAFIQANWTGPPVDEAHVIESCPWLMGGQESYIRENVCACLVLDGESLAPCVVLPHLLVAARVALYVNEWRLSDLQSSGWWSLRYLFVHQQVLEEKSPQIHSALKKALAEVSNQEILSASSANGKLRTLFHIECAIMYLYYFEVLRSDEHLQEAGKIAGLDVSLGGALGKRTRFQQKDIAQLTLNVKCENSYESLQDDNSFLPEHDLPKDLQLEDEVRLNQIQFLNSEDGEIPTLKPVEQAVIFGFFVQNMKSQPKDKLAVEELLTYITSLVDSIKAEKPEARIRHKYFYSCRMPPYWNVECELAQMFLSLGAVNSALEIFLRLQQWEEVIVCYTILELKHKAIEIIEQQLAAKETVKLWCLLGDSKDDINCYEKAWELSGQQSARAQRHWGLHYYFKGKHAEAIPHMQKSLEINSLQLLLWSRLGFSALTVENWELAASAYRRYCSLETENFEAWNNLAKAYVKSGQKARAWKALQEALKCNFENWKVWDNLMVVSTDCGEFEEVIRAYHRILDLKEKHVDTEVLDILVKAVTKNELDNQGVPAGRLKAKSLALFGRLTAQVTNDAKVWLLYAKLTSGTSDPTVETLTKVAQFLQKGHRSAVQVPNWEKDVKSCVEAIEMSEGLANAYMECVQNCASNQAVQMLSSAKLAIKGVVTKVKQYHLNSLTEEIVSSEIIGPLARLEVKLEEIISEIARHQASR